MASAVVPMDIVSKIDCDDKAVILPVKTPRVFSSACDASLIISLEGVEGDAEAGFGVLTCTVSTGI